MKDRSISRHDRMDTACIFDGDSIGSGTQFGNEGTAQRRLFDTKRTTTVALAMSTICPTYGVRSGSPSRQRSSRLRAAAVALSLQDSAVYRTGVNTDGLMAREAVQ